MTKSLIITFDEKNEMALMSFLKKHKIKTIDTQKQAIQVRIQQAIHQVYGIRLILKKKKISFSGR